MHLLLAVLAGTDQANNLHASQNVAHKHEGDWPMKPNPPSSIVSERKYFYGLKFCFLTRLSYTYRESSQDSTVSDNRSLYSLPVKSCGCTLYVVYRIPAKKQLSSPNFGLPKAHLFRDTSAISVSRVMMTGTAYPMIIFLRCLVELWAICRLLSERESFQDFCYQT